MRFPFLNRLIGRARSRRHRHIMRGYHHLKAAGDQGRLDKLKYAITDIQLDRINGRVSRTIFGAAFDHAELATRQYLLVRAGDFPFYRALLVTLGLPGSRVVHPLPRAWWACIEDGGFQIAKVRSTLLWIGYVLAIFGYGVMTGVRRLVSGGEQTVPSDRAYAHFDGIGPNCLPQRDDGQAHDLLSWYVRFIGDAGRGRTVSHSVPNKKTTVLGTHVGFRPTLPSPPDRTAYAWWLLRATAVSAFDLLRGRWWSAFMLFEATKAASMRLCRETDVAERYLMSNSSHLYRPLWTYEADQRGAEIILYFYSTNCEGFKRSWGYPIQTSSWQIANWPSALVWDQWQVEFVRRAAPLIGDTRIVGPIDFTDQAIDLPKTEGASIAAFDVQPFRSSLYQSFAPGLEVYVPDNCVRFLREIESVAIEQDMSLLWKRKRDIGSLQHPQYRKLLSDLDGKSHIIAVDPAIAAYRVVEAVDIVISMPFTSTAHIAYHLGKPSCYYDPLALMQPDDRAAHGIPIIQSRAALAEWIRANNPVAPSKNLVNVSNDE